jgi:hypothetical protein
MKEFKYSHFRVDGCYCATIAFKHLPGNPDYPEVAYGVTIISRQEKQVSYKTGRKIAESRCLQAVDGKTIDWSDYKGRMCSRTHWLVDIIKHDTTLKKLGRLSASEFKNCIEILREAGL